MSPRLFLAVAALLLVAGCATTPPASQLSLAGAASGAPNHDPRIAALVGSGASPLPGSGVGAYMDQEEAELRTQLLSTGVSVTRAGNQIALNLPASLVFDSDKSAVRASFAGKLGSVGAVLAHFGKTVVDVYGYSDATGSDAHNKDLTQRRAVAVATLLANQGVDQQRFYIEGRGPADPIASNATDIGRAQNWRIEIQLSPLT